MEFLPGFRWPVPRAFASAVSVCRFEQGDVLFDAADAYAAWQAGSRRKARIHVQVLDPPRAARAAHADSESRFTANWSSPVTCEVGDRSGSTTPVVRSTQGRLFTCLWRGDLRVLREVGPGAVEELALPGGARDLQKQLTAALAGFQATAAGTAETGFWFVSVVDVSSESSLAKARSVESELSGRYALTIRDLAPQEAGIPDGDRYHPALRVRGVWVEDESSTVVEQLLKQ